MGRKLSLLAAAAALISGCGGGDGDGASSPPPVEKADPPAKLPPRWETVANRSAGLTIGLPPLWTASPKGVSTSLTSPDKQVAITASADRTNEALSVPLERFVLEAAKNLPGFEDLKVGLPVAYDARYSAEAVKATGTLAVTGVRQRLRFVVLRRDAIAAFPVLAAVKLRSHSPFAKQVDPIIRSLRGRPVEVP